MFKCFSKKGKNKYNSALYFINVSFYVRVDVGVKYIYVPTIRKIMHTRKTIL